MSMYTHSNKNHSTGRWNNRKKYNNNSFLFNNEDPFAGMKASVNYEKEIERLKQTYNNKGLTPITTTNVNTKSRSTTPEDGYFSSSSSESDMFEEQQQVSEEDKNRFLAFIRSWTTGDCPNQQQQQQPHQHHHESFWSVPTPWKNPIKNNINIPVKNHQLLLSPIGTGRKAL